MIQGLERGALVIPKEIYQVNIVMQTATFSSGNFTVN